MNDYLLSFDPPDEWDALGWRDWHEILKRFSTTLNFASPPTCPVCGEHHYMPNSIATPLSFTPEQMRQQLERICQMNRGAYYVQPHYQPMISWQQPISSDGRRPLKSNIPL